MLNEVNLKEKMDKNKFYFKVLKTVIISLLLILGVFTVIQFCLFNVFGWNIYLSILFVVFGCWFMFEPFNKITEYYLLKKELDLLYSAECTELFPIKFNSGFIEEKSFFLNISGYHKNIDVLTRKVYISKKENINKYSYYNVYESCVNPEYDVVVCVKRHNGPIIINDVKIQDFAQNIG